MCLVSESHASLEVLRRFPSKQHNQEQHINTSLNKEQRKHLPLKCSSTRQPFPASSPQPVYQDLVVVTVSISIGPRCNHNLVVHVTQPIMYNTRLTLDLKTKRSVTKLMNEMWSLDKRGLGSVVLNCSFQQRLRTDLCFFLIYKKRRA
ncbi:uncharacterized, partial [Tachysurus ichikawai]